MHAATERTPVIPVPSGRLDDSPTPASVRRAALVECAPLLVAAAIFAGVGAVAASLGVDVGPDRIHLSILFYALAAVSVVGALAAALRASDEAGSTDSDPPPLRPGSRSDDLGRPAPAVARKTDRAPSPSPETGDLEPSVGPRTTGDEVDRALAELDQIRTELDPRPARKRRTDRRDP